MTKEQYLKNLNVPSGRVDVILDTDAYNEIDDQFAISYLLLSEEKLNTVGLCAAPFFNSLSAGAKDGLDLRPGTAGTTECNHLFQILNGHFSAAAPGKFFRPVQVFE